MLFVGVGRSLAVVGVGTGGMKSEVFEAIGGGVVGSGSIGVDCLTGLPFAPMRVQPLSGLSSTAAGFLSSSVSMSLSSEVSNRPERGSVVSGS